MATISYVFEFLTPDVAYNCDCDAGATGVTLLTMQTRLATRLGYAATAGNLPPGMAAFLNDLINSAQEQLHLRYPVLALQRYYSWALVPGIRFYDLPDNLDDCRVVLDPRGVRWVGLSTGPDNWQPLAPGIPPELHTSAQVGRPQRYEVRQCIEVWPTPTVSGDYLRIVGAFKPATLVNDTDQLVVDPEAVFLHALATAKAHDGQPDWQVASQQLSSYIGTLTAGAHQTRRYVPGTPPWPYESPMINRIIPVGS